MKVNKLNYSSNDQLLSSDKEPVAIIGIGCRFPGRVKDPESFWHLLENKIDGIRKVPEDRWDIRQFYDANPDRPGKIYIKEAGFLDERLDYFDPLFFGISPREAVHVDPQQRLLLETTWEAIEDAGLIVENLSNSETGVFIGGFCLDSKLIQLSNLNRELISAHTSTGATMTMLANKISYLFDLRGPSITMDTACSSSLNATHFACRSLWNDDCSLAIVGGVNTMLIPEYITVMCKGKFLSRHSRCMAFDEKAEGYTRAEGAGVVILKPFSAALKDNDSIYALIRETGSNQDGHTTGISLPNPDAQKELILQVYNRANIKPRDIQYIEAHGTGTQAGDQAELKALDEIFSNQGTNGNKCFVGSVKTNFGHLEAGAGVAGLIKATLCLHKKKIPPNLHFNNPNPKIPFEKLCIRIPTKMEDWPSIGKIRFAGVNSFGYGGSNVHVLLQEAPRRQKDEKKTGTKNRPVLIPLSARSENALKSLAGEYYNFLKTNRKNLPIQDICYSTAFRRSHHKYRMITIADSKEKLVENYYLFSQEENRPEIISGVASENNPKKVFVYTGMGPQWWAMGRELMEREHVYRKTVEKCAAAFKNVAGWSLIEALNADENSSQISKTNVSQPTNFALQVALTELLASWGIKPDAVVGHSVGEVSAFYAAGVYSLKDAVLISYYRSHLQQQVAGKGAMLAADISESEAEALLKNYKNVSVAAINSHSSVTLSGKKESLKKISNILEKHDIFYKFLGVEVAYHSYQMNPLYKELTSCLAKINPHENNIPLYSTVTGKLFKGKDGNEEYWWKNVRQPVRFAPSINSILKDGYKIFIQVGPHPVLNSSIRACYQKAGIEGYNVPTLIRKEPEVSKMLQCIGNLYTLGIEPDWNSINPEGGRYIKLPSYPWQREHYWIESERSREERLGLQGHVYLNKNMRLPYPAWEVELNEHYFPYLKDHRIEGTVVFPGACYTEAGLALHEKVFNITACTLENIKFHQVLVAEQNRIQRLHFAFNPKTNMYSVYSRFIEDEPCWTLHATGKILPALSETPPEKININSMKKRHPQEISAQRFYEILDNRGLNYGPFFQGIKEIWKSKNSVFVKIIGDESLSDNKDQYLIHPTILDVTFQSLIAMIDKTENSNVSPFIPVGIEQVCFYSSAGNECYSYAEITKKTDNVIKGNLTLFDEHGKVCTQIKAITCRAVSEKQKNKKGNIEELCYEFSWEQTAHISIQNVLPDDRLLIFGDDSLLTKEIVRNVSAKAIDCILITSSDQYQKLADNKYVVRRNSAQDIGKLFSNMKKSKISSILYLWSLRHKNLIVKNTISELLDYCSEITLIVKELSEINTPISLNIVTRNSQVVVPEDSGDNLTTSVLWGLGYLIGNEHLNVNAKLIDIENDRSDKQYLLIINEILSGNTDSDVAFRSGKRFVKKLKKAELNLSTDEPEQRSASTDESVSLHLEVPGKQESLVYHENKRKNPGANEIEMKVFATPINFKDILKVHSSISSDVLEGTFFGESLGMECSGIVLKTGTAVKDFKVGDEIFIGGIQGGFHSYITIPTTNLILKKPAPLKFEEVVIFVPFFTAYYGLIKLANLQRGEKVLIHNATGGVGLSSLQVARTIGAEIFATAGSEEKRNYLKSLGVTQVMNSRSLEFSEKIKQITEGKGVDVVIGAVNGEMLLKSFEILAPYGRYIEIGKKDIAENSGLPMKTFNRNIAFISLDIDRMLLEKPQIMKEVWDNEIGPGFESKEFTALPTTVFPASKVKEAFQFVREGKHIGKVVVSFENDNILVKATSDKPKLILKNGTYLITGGTGGLGLEIAKWLSSKGAGQLVLISRRGKIDKQDADVIKNNGTRLSVHSVDIGDEEQVRDLITEIKEKMPPLHGIFHCAMVLDDGFLVDLNKERFQKVLKPKVSGAIYLHHYTLDQPLDFFISFSSISSIIGNKGQANYVAANTFLDSFAHFRQSKKLPATTINLGVVSNVGVVARNKRLDDLFKLSGIKGLSNEAICYILEIIIDKRPPQIGFFDVDWPKWAKINQKNANSSRFNSLVTIYAHSDKEIGKKSKLIDELNQLDENKQLSFVITLVKKEVAEVLKSSTDTIDINQSITNLGIDSLMVAELQNAIISHLGIELTTMELLKGPSCVQLAKLLMSKTDGLQQNTEINTPSRVNIFSPHKTDASLYLKDNNDVFINKISDSLDTVKEQFERELDEKAANKIDIALSANKDTKHSSIDNPMLKDIPEKYFIIDSADEIQQFHQQYMALQEQSIANPYFRVNEGIVNDSTIINNKNLISYSSYNYLGLSGNRKVSEMVKKAIDQYGTSVSASRIATGERPLHRELEKEIADFIGVEDSIVYVSGHATNVTTIGHLFRPKDLIIHDSLIHNSILQGCLLAGSRRIPFPHNNWQALEEILNSNRTNHERTLIIIEGVYSMDGDIPDLPKFIKIKKDYKALLMIDEAHSLGVLGKTGRGIGEYFGISSDDVDLWMGTLSKSLASCGGYIAGSKLLVRYLKYTAPGFLYSVGISPANAQASLTALKILKEEPERVENLQNNSKYFLTLAKENNLDTGSSHDSAVVPIIVRNSSKCIKLSHFLFEKGINVQPILYPAVPENETRLRFFITSEHSKEQISYTIEKITEGMKMI